MPRLPKKEELESWLSRSYSYHFRVKYSSYEFVVGVIGINEKEARERVTEAFPEAIQDPELSTAALRILC